MVNDVIISFKVQLKCFILKVTIYNISSFAGESLYHKLFPGELIRSQ